jgi:cysteine-S-conjugate beta-lyase
MRHDRHVPSFDVDAIDLAALRERQSAKYQYFAADVIPAWVAEMDFPLAAPVAAALHAAIDRSDTGYRSAIGLADALADFARDRWGWGIPRERITPMADVLTGAGWAMRLFTEPGDGVVVTPPVYTPFYSTIRDTTRRTVVEVPLVRADDGTYDWDLAGMEQAFARPDVTAFLMSNPHNPTGTVPTPAMLTAIAEAAAAHGVTVISDEIHGPLALPGSEHVPFMSVAPDDADAVILVSASKGWNLPGLKCAQLVGTARTAPIIAERLPMDVTYGTGQLGVIASVAAYRDGGPWLDDVVAIIDGNRTLLTELLAEHLPRAGYVPPQASYLAWLDLRAYDLGDDPAAVLLEKGRVALSSGPSYGTGGEGFARLNLATSPRILSEIVRRMGTVVQ